MSIICARIIRVLVWNCFDDMLVIFLKVRISRIFRANQMGLERWNIQGRGTVCSKPFCFRFSLKHINYYYSYHGFLLTKIEVWCCL